MSWFVLDTTLEWVMSELIRLRHRFEQMIASGSKRIGGQCMS